MTTKIDKEQIEFNDIIKRLSNILSRYHTSESIIKLEDQNVENYAKLLKLKKEFNKVLNDIKFNNFIIDDIYKQMSNNK